jgi:glycosyltransferase involved in cell wall biosynthesis
MKSLDIIIRTHDKSNVSKFPRFISVSKRELIEGCMTSMINSANQCKNKINIIVLDDHSSQEFLHNLHNILKTSRHSIKIISLEEGGPNQSALSQFEYCKNSTADLVYSVEDDYLHSPSALYEMLSEYDYLSSKYNLPQPLCIFPWDEPETYDPKHNTPELIMRGQYRHWKTGWGTTFTMMTSPKVFQDHWKLFETLATEYKEWDGTGNKNDTIHEGNTISYIWSKHIIRINPIPSLVLHMQSSLQEDSYIDWKYWWNTYTHKAKHFELSYL